MCARVCMPLPQCWSENRCQSLPCPSCAAGSCLLLSCPPHKLVGTACWSDSQPPLLCRSNGITGVFYHASGLYIGSEDLNSGLHAFMTNRLALSPLPSTNFHSWRELRWYRACLTWLKPPYWYMGLVLSRWKSVEVACPQLHSKLEGNLG